MERIKSVGLNAQPSIGEERTVIGVIGDKTRRVDIPIEPMSGVERTTPISVPYKLASRQFRDEPTTIEVNGTKIGGKQIVHIAKEIAKSGAIFIRGGAFKPRTGPYSFQGYGEPALKMLVELVSKYTDIFQLGTRNMQNFYLLREVGKSGKPVVLKRGLSATIEAWLLAAEYILSEGNPNAILCERGIRTFETHTRNTLDLNTVPAIKGLSHLPIVVDPSHGTGIRSLVAPMAKASIAAGADGLLLEVHPLRTIR